MLKAPTASASKFEARRGAAAAASAATAVKVVYNFFFLSLQPKIESSMWETRRVRKDYSNGGSYKFLFERK